MEAIDSRPVRPDAIFGERRRRRRCASCGHRVTTYERVSDEDKDVALEERLERLGREGLVRKEGEPVILIALDVDGTLDTSGGPVPWKVVEFVHFHTPPGIVRIAVVSPSPHWPGSEATGIPLFADGATRAENLKMAADEFPWCTERYYLSDNADQGEAADAGFEYVDRAEWPRVVARVADAALAVRAKP